MKIGASLGRQLAFTMVGLSISILLLAFCTIYATYWAILRFAPSLMDPQDSALPNGTDFALLLVLALIALAVATRVAFRMAVRIAEPITSVAQAARMVAEGNLTARAEPGDRSLGETAMLADDFNAMAARLEKMAQDVVVWNAQIAHELRTPLTILRGRLQGVSDGVFLADDALIASLTKQVDGLARLVEDLRVVSLFDSGRLVLDIRTVDLAREITELVEFVRPQLESQGFSLSLRLDPGPCTLDPIRIRQAVMALIDNARKHAPPGVIGIQLDIDPKGVRLGVSDAGPGLSDAFADNAFALFSRAEGRTPSSRGSGLGLSVIRAIMQAHGGQARYDTETSEFVLEMPCRP